MGQDGAISIIHLMNRDVSARELIHDKESLESFLVEDLNEGNVKYLEWLMDLPKFLTEKEIKKISEGKDVYINTKRLRKLLKRLDK